MKSPLNFIDGFLNNITMYRLVLYVLSLLTALALILNALGIQSLGFVQLLESLVVILAVSFSSNYIFSKIFKAPLNPESQWISAFILFLIIAPPVSLTDLWVPAFVAVAAMLSKYVFAIGKKHIFNPVAIALVAIGLFGRGDAMWWSSSLLLLPVIVVGGLLILRKVRRFTLFFSFALPALLGALYFGTSHGMAPLEALFQTIASGPLLFFATVMLTEPQTMPPTRKLQIFYGVLVGFFFSVHFNVTVFGMMSASTPELALVMGNVFSYIVSPKRKLILALKERKEVARNTFELLFTPKNKFNFLPGQFLEWTFPHKGMDTRGARRYFTIASSPTEETIDIGIRYTPEASSSFKRALNGQNIDQRIIASQLAGEFVMPKDKNQKLVFIAGGIGITPFRSMIKYLLDTNEKRDIVLFYSNKTEQEIAYRDIFDQAVRDIGIKVLYVLTDLATPQGWTGKRGFVNAEMIKAEVSDYTERMFYISGPHGMVTAFEHTLADLGVPGGNIKVDFFPGFA